MVWLDDARADIADLGGKGASLAELRRAGFNVPPGFAIVAAGYRRFIDANGLGGLIQQVVATPDLRVPRVAREACTELTSRLERASLPDDLVAAITAGYRELQRRAGPAVVTAARSSAVSEDAAGASSAGLYETYLNLRDQGAVLDGVLECYRSLWTPRAVQYRAFKNIDSAREAMAVVVMEMVPSDVSGVAFTVNPITADRSQITINASWGLGEGIVSGRVTPDQYLLDKSSLAVVSREIHPKEVAVRPQPGGGSGVAVLDLSPEQSELPSLTDGQAQELGETCLRIERHYGRPVDVEWAYAGPTLYILQARPVTGLP